MADWTVEELEHWDHKISQIGEKYGLDWYEIDYEIIDYQEKNGVEFHLRGFVKAELFNDEQARAMRRAGFRWLLTGFESGDDRILTNIRKNATRDDNTRCIETAKKNGLKVKALMSVGHAGESHESIENTKKWLLALV